MDDRVHRADRMGRRQGDTCLVGFFLYRVGRWNFSYLVNVCKFAGDDPRLADLHHLGRRPPPALFGASAKVLANLSFLRLENLLDIPWIVFCRVFSVPGGNPYHSNPMGISRSWIIDSR